MSKRTKNRGTSTVLSIKGNLNGHGVSMQVITRVFEKSNYIWFSKVYGEFNDNLIMFAFRPDNNLVTDKKIYENNDSKRLLFGPPMRCEYKITKEIEQRMGLEANNDGLKIDNIEKCELCLYSHDNYFFQIEPISPTLPKELLGVILKHHDYYFGYEVDWNEVEDRLLECLYTVGEITIQSDPKKRYVWIPELEENKPLFWKQFRKGTIIIQNKITVFRKT